MQEQEQRRGRGGSGGAVGRAVAEPAHTAIIFFSQRAEQVDCALTFWQKEDMRGG